MRSESRAMPANVKPPAKPVDIYYFKVAKIVNILGCKGILSVNKKMIV
ncbi:hypothetical protein CLORAM_00321 [Thomasclavelia ramosa DSM 1402]|jgi:hypothetical protein|uniref:Uncharacterized protein n=1 Tax=Thomasclavelia ramosa DSM 1402 TaxID=445974 RepID=B0N1B6_9FIRM|nr:hypothetical protein CLORAM_00321 [Thomasclavelia ramosa DSM 1402]